MAAGDTGTGKSGLLLALQYMVDDDMRVLQHDDNGTADHLWQIKPVN